MHDKSALYLPRQCLRNGGKSLDFIGFLGWKRRIYTLFTPLEDWIGIVRIGRREMNLTSFFLEFM